MPAAQKVVARVPSMDTDPIFIAVEMSRSKWVVGTHVPTSDKVSIYTMAWGDIAALFSLIDRLRSGLRVCSGPTFPSSAAMRRVTKASGYTAYSRLPATAYS